MHLPSDGVTRTFSTYWCEQASSAAQGCKEMNEAWRSGIYLQSEQGMDDAQRAERRGVWWEELLCDDDLSS